MTQKEQGKMKRLSSYLVTLAIGVLFLLSSCVRVQRRDLFTPEQVLAPAATPWRGIRATNSELPNLSQSPYLKAHMLNGGVYLFNEWSVDKAGRSLSGNAEYQNYNREKIELGRTTIYFDSVALLETNQNTLSGGAAALAVMTGISAALTAYCIANPKACFGSCPTFYASDGEQMVLQAEGFSSSVAPALEASDIDALYRAKPNNPNFTIVMKNEALETHVVRYADIIAVPRSDNGRVFPTSDGLYWQADKIIEPSQSNGPEGNCLENIKNFDGIERFSLTDSIDLAAKESLDLVFTGVEKGEWGLVIASRQSLVTTYLFYQILSYLGHDAPATLACLRRSKEIYTNGGRDYEKLLGNIEIYLGKKDGLWELVGNLYETGPLATDVHLIKMPNMEEDTARVRIIMSKGCWRIDQIAFAKLSSKITGIRIKPAVVIRDGIVMDSLKQLLLDSTRTLVTMPGDSITIAYELPQDYGNYELFLESRGYYLEWMRDEWMAEENPGLAAVALVNPREMLRILAPEYKKLEADMEQSFWSSRYAK
jgi:hypothetical protein